MFCESYRAELSEAILRGERLRGDAEAHLAGCAPCREALSRERALFGLLNSELRALANSEVPTSLVPKVRSQIAELPESRTWLSPLLAYGAAALTLVAVVLAFGARSRAPLVQQQNVVREASAGAPAEQNTPPSQNEPVRQVVIGPQQINMRPRAVVQSHPEVLVAAEEQLGLQRYAASLKIAATGRPAVVKADAATEIAPLEIAGIDVRRLSIEPLESGDANGILFAPRLVN